MSILKMFRKQIQFKPTAERNCMLLTLLFIPTSCSQEKQETLSASVRGVSRLGFRFPHPFPLWVIFPGRTLFKI